MTRSYLAERLGLLIIVWTLTVPLINIAAAGDRLAVGVIQAFVVCPVHPKHESQGAAFREKGLVVDESPQRERSAPARPIPDAAAVTSEPWPV